MNIEQAIQENTAAVTALTVALQNFIGRTETAKDDAIRLASAAEPAEKKGKAKLQAVPAEPEAPLEPASAFIVLRDAWLRLFEKDTGKAKHVLTVLGVDKLTKIKPEQYEQALGLTKKALG